MALLGSEASGLGSVQTAAGERSPEVGNVNKIIPGAGISVSPSSGTGNVTVTNTQTAPTPGTGVAGPTALGAAGAAATFRRSDQTAAAYRSDLPLSTTWFIDPVNGSDASTNPGTSSATALQSLQELKRRWWGAEISTTTTVTILGHTLPADAGSWNTAIAPAGRVTFLGSLGPTTGFGGAAIDNTLYTGTLSAVQTTPLAPSTNDTSITDAGIPVSYTASGLLAPGIIFRRPAGAGPSVEWLGAKDKGAKTLRISPPLLNTTALLTNLAPGDAYSAFQMWKIFDQDFGAFASRVRFDSLDDEGTASEQAGNQGVQRRRVWIGVRTTVAIPVSGAINCAFASGAADLIATTNEITGIQGGLFLGNGAGFYQLFGMFSMSQPWVQQGAALGMNDGGFASIEWQGGAFDCTGPCFQVTAQAKIALELNPGAAGGGISGAGNSSKLVQVLEGGEFYWTGFNQAAPPFAAGSTSDSAPIQIGGTSYTIAALPTVGRTSLSGKTTFPTPNFEFAPLRNGASAMVTFVSRAIDLTIGGGINLGIPLVPAMPGYYFIPFSDAYLVTAAAGTLSTSPTLRAGNDAGHTNAIAQAATAPSAAAVARTVAVGVPTKCGAQSVTTAGLGQVATETLIDLAAPILADVPVGATGTGLTLTAQLHICGWLVHT